MTRKIAQAKRPCDLRDNNEELRFGGKDEESFNSQKARFRSHLSHSQNVNYFLRLLVLLYHSQVGIASN